MLTGFYLFSLCFTVFLGCQTLVGKALSFTHKLHCFSMLKINLLCSAAAQWMAIKLYFGSSVVGKASTIGIEISPTPPLNFHRGGGQKVRNLASFSTSLDSEPLAFENAARYPKAETNFLCRNDCPMYWPSLAKLGLRIPENRLSVVPHPYNCTAKTC